MLYVYCEGPTEALFVARVLNPKFLEPCGKFATAVTADGLRPFGKVQADLQDLLRNRAARVTTLIDYYAMPPDYPGMPHRPLPPGNRAIVFAEITRLENALTAALDNEPHFIANYCLHEIESLAFTSPEAINEQHRRINNSSILPQVAQILSAVQGNPELVNDSPTTSPSHRLEALWPPGQYQKTVDSIGIMQRIPFQHLLNSCQHFAAWAARL